MGTFWTHAVSSIPFLLEENARNGAALLRYTQALLDKDLQKDIKLHSLGAADGTFARTASLLSGGRIQSLTNSPTPGNGNTFFNDFPYQNAAHFLLGSFTDISIDSLKTDERLTKFRDGFDVILERVTYPMYSGSAEVRNQQISFSKETLKENGLMILMEKVGGENYVF